MRGRALLSVEPHEPGVPDAATVICALGCAFATSIPRALRPTCLSLVGAFTLRRRGIEAQLVPGNMPSALDRTLVRTIALGWAWFEEIKAGATMQAIANREGVTQRRVASWRQTLSAQSSRVASLQR